MSENNMFEQKIEDLEKTIEDLLELQKENHNNLIAFAKHISALETIVIDKGLVSNRVELERKIKEAEVRLGKYTFK
ncbi:hypothetical protein [Oceanobacillus sp. J11TS1]|uniref:hypothetical protein n=1 Tax=Oceanobacillus sp. J11TS1 TaxID=2807191 RepID=UPI001B1F8290|nr:hypothetical protein [Oceanobacillus sp. J11TS1]GIO25152.1 hypothetical protein J11TS1_37330 [Oceanobacillus sp. J11TS1]